MHLSAQGDELRHELGELLCHLTSALHRHYRANPRALASGDYTTLMQLKRGGATRGGDLAAGVGADASTMSRRIASLETRGLVARETDPADRRSSIVRLTPAGARAAEVAEGERVSGVFEALTSWDSDDLAELTRIVSRLNQAFESRSSAKRPEGGNQQ